MIDTVATVRPIEPSRLAGGSMGARPSSFDLAEAYDAHGSAMLGYAVNALHDRPLAEDVVQETFLRAWKSRHSFDPGKGALRTWLFTIERNVITDLVRALARTPKITDRASEDRGLDDSAPAILDRLVVAEALAILSDEHRQVVTAVHLKGASYADISAATGTPVATLRSRCFYALRALRAHFEGLEDT